MGRFPAQVIPAGIGVGSADRNILAKGDQAGNNRVPFRKGI